MNVGVVGCGAISGIYLQNAAKLEDIRVIACSDLDMDKARTQAVAYGVPKVCTVEQLMADSEVEIVLNLTVPHAHAPVALQAISAGKHVYGEKPLAVSREEGRAMLEAARKAGVRLGCAPDTFLGGAIQTCRKLIDEGTIGEPVAATAFMMCRGHENWHPNPEFYYHQGGGPLFDMGPYYLTALINLIGPVTRVCGGARITFPERTITSQPKYGQKITVTTPTHITGTMEFACGALATVAMSFDVHAHHAPCLEIYGSEGSLVVPDPNSFGAWRSDDQLAPIYLWTAATRRWVTVEYTHGYRVNARGVGVADMARAIQTNRPHRASGDMAYHVLDIMQAFLDSAASGRWVRIESTCQRPPALPVGLTDGELD